MSSPIAASPRSATRLPGEHGFRFFPGFYKHVIDTMRRMPSFDGRTAADHLVPTTRIGLTQYGRPMFEVPAHVSAHRARRRHAVARRAAGCSGRSLGITPEELAFFGARFWQFLDLVRGAAHRRIRADQLVGIRRRANAARPIRNFSPSASRARSSPPRRDKASARTVGDMFVQMMMTFLDPVAGTTDRVLDGPTNLAWIDPWRSYLESRGVDSCMQTRSRADSVRRRRDHRRRRAAQRRARQLVEGDYYVAAMPIERIAPLVNASAARRRSRAGQLAHAGAERRVDERHSVLSAARRADLPTAM